MMNLFKIFFVFFACFFIVNPAIFSTNIFSDERILGLCPRETDVFADRVINDENVVRNYGLSLSGSAASWGIVAPASFILAPGEEKTVYIYVTAPRDADPGNYNFVVNVDSGSSARTITHVVKVKDCYGFSLTSGEDSSSVFPIDNSSFSATVTNRGEFAQNFNLNLDGNLASSAVLSENAFALQPGGSKQVVINLNAPADHGIYNLELNAEGGKNRKSIDFELVVGSCYQYELNLRAETGGVSMCERTITSVPFVVKNLGTVPNTFYLEIEDGPLWARLNMDNIVLNPNESRAFLAALAPNYDDVGNHSISVVVSPEKGSVVARGTANVEVRDCHAVRIDVTKTEDSVCKEFTSAYDINIENTGESVKTFDITVDGPLWMRLAGQSSVELRAGRNANFAIFATPEDDTAEGEYEAIVSVSSRDGRATAEEKIKIDVLGSDECFAADIILKYGSIIVHPDSGLLVPVTLKNSGSKITDYKLELGGSAAAFANIAESEFSLEPVSEIAVDVYVAPRIDTAVGFYTLDINLNAGDTAVSTGTINVEVTDDASRVTVINGSGDEENDTKDFFRENKFFILLFLVLAVIVVLAFMFGRKAIDFFEDMDDEEDKK